MGFKKNSDWIAFFPVLIQLWFVFSLRLDNKLIASNYSDDYWFIYREDEAKYIFQLQFKHGNCIDNSFESDYGAPDGRIYDEFPSIIDDNVDGVERW